MFGCCLLVSIRRRAITAVYSTNGYLFNVRYFTRRGVSSS